MNLKCSICITDLMADLQGLCDITKGDRDPDAARCEYIIKMLLDYSIPFRVEMYKNYTPINIIVEFGKNPHLFVVGGHYDVIGNTSGANDNGMGIMALISLARNLIQANYEGDLTIVFFDNEENLAGKGCYKDMGSVCYIKKATEEERHANKTLILDVIGVGDTPYISTRGTLYEDEKVFEHLTTWTKSIPPSDNLCFMEAGWPVWLLCSAWEHEVRGGYPETYNRFHSPEDTPDQDGMNPKMVLDIVDRVANLVRAWNHEYTEPVEIKRIS